MDPSSSKVRLAAMAATLIALLAISIPFVWQHEIDATPSGPGAAGTGPAATPAPLASHEAGGTGAAMAPGDQDAAACPADAPAANLDFTLPDITGTDVALASFKGKVILLNFWATWCGPCKAEIPSFVELQAQYPDDLVIVGLSVDDPADKAAAFAREYQMNYPVLLGLGHEEIQDAYGPIWGIPASFVISRDGRVCKKHLGISPKAVFEKEITALM
ncbi:MAG: TlpA family protein disulfide reductase [Vicinamibacterales bacterium]